VPKQRMGHAISTFFTLFDLGMAMGSVILGLIIAYYGYQMTYLFCAVITVATLFVYKYTVSAALKQPK